MANPLTQYFKATYEEFKKVVWPSRHETIQHTLIVIGLSLGLAVFLGAIDYVLNLGLQQLLLRQ